MANWTIDRVSIELLEDDDAQFFGINQTQDVDENKMAPGAFYAEIWAADKSRRITSDLDQGLPPIGSYEPHLVQATEMPNEGVQLNCFSTSAGSEERKNEYSQKLAMPENGWTGRMVQIFWKQAD